MRNRLPTADCCARCRGNATAESKSKMPQVQVSLYATLRQYVGGAAQVEPHIAPGQTVQQVLDQLNVPAGQTRIMFINNRAAKLTDV